MQVEDLYRQLSYGELGNLAVAVDKTGTLKPDAHPRIIHLANEALTRLYSRFLIDEKSLILEQVEDQTSYPLKRAFAESVWQPGDVGVAFIKDLEDPFQEDVLQVLQVYDAYGINIPLNQREKYDFTVLTPSPGLLVIPKPKAGAPLSVVYQAKHPVLTEELDQEIFLPDVLIEAMTGYIASKMYASVGTPDALASSAQCFTRYQTVCDEVERFSLLHLGGLSAGTRFQDKGWV